MKACLSTQSACFTTAIGHYQLRSLLWPHLQLIISPLGVALTPLTTTLHLYEYTLPQMWPQICRQHCRMIISFPGRTEHAWVHMNWCGTPQYSSLCSCVKVPRTVDRSSNWWSTPFPASVWGWPGTLESTPHSAIHWPPPWYNCAHNHSQSAHVYI